MALIFKKKENPPDRPTFGAIRRIKIEEKILKEK